MRAAALATAAAGLLAGAAPYHKYGCADDKDQGKYLLPFHAANITAKANRATGIFQRNPGCPLPLRWLNMFGKMPSRAPPVNLVHASLETR